WIFLSRIELRNRRANRRPRRVGVGIGIAAHVDQVVNHENDGKRDEKSDDLFFKISRRILKGAGKLSRIFDRIGDIPLILVDWPCEHDGLLLRDLFFGWRRNTRLSWPLNLFFELDRRDLGVSSLRNHGQFSTLILILV